MTDPWSQPEARSFLEGVAEGSLAGGLFEPQVPVVLARAPGRLDVMGGIADYSGALVLEWPIARATFAAIQRSTAAKVRVVSYGGGVDARRRDFEIQSAELTELSLRGYEALGERLHQRPEDRWAAYVIGVLSVLLRERDLELDGGLRVLVRSWVPEGKGVSSSAALEVSVMRALVELLGVSMGSEEVARLCQLAENRVVGAPCGIMDQMTASLGRENRLLSLLCQPAEVCGHLEVPDPIRFWGLDSGVRHEVSGADYISVRTAAFMGYSILADEAGLTATEPDADGYVRVEDPRWHGYLANVGVEDLEAHYLESLPTTIGGDEFLNRYGGIVDRVTRVEPSRSYAVRSATEHPVREHARVGRFRDLLSSDLDVSEIDEAKLAEMGELMYASHRSYSACGLGSSGTDRLVELVREAGVGAGLYGAKITGGGSGGTVAVLGRVEAAPVVRSIVRRYAEETGYPPVVFSDSSPGAERWGVRRITATEEMERR